MLDKLMKATREQVGGELTSLEERLEKEEYQDRIGWEINTRLVGREMEVLVDGPSEDPAFAFEGRTVGQAPEIDGLVYLRDPGRLAFTPGHFARIRIVEAEGYELIGERA